MLYLYYLYTSRGFSPYVGRPCCMYITHTHIHTHVICNGCWLSQQTVCIQALIGYRSGTEFVVEPHYRPIIIISRDSRRSQQSLLLFQLLLLLLSYLIYTWKICVVFLDFVVKSLLVCYEWNIQLYLLSDCLFCLSVRAI